MNKLLTALSYVLLLMISAGCEEAEENPLIECVSATVIGTTCDGAFLLQLDTSVPIGTSLSFSGDMGAPINGPAAVSTTYANVVKTFSPLPPPYRGNSEFFRLRLATPQEQIDRFCTANKVWYDAPQVIVIDSFAACKPILLK
jgi:hypothetical protein